MLSIFLRSSSYSEISKSMLRDFDLSSILGFSNLGSLCWAWNSVIGRSSIIYLTELWGLDSPRVIRSCDLPSYLRWFVFSRMESSICSWLKLVATKTLKWPAKWSSLFFIKTDLLSVLYMIFLYIFSVFYISSVFEDLS